MFVTHRRVPAPSRVSLPPCAYRRPASSPSCAPNAACGVVTDASRRNRLLYYTKRAIKAGEEVVYDYLKGQETSQMKDGPRLTCLCGAKKCRKTLPGF